MTDSISDTVPIICCSGCKESHTDEANEDRVNIIAGPKTYWLKSLGYDRLKLVYRCCFLSGSSFFQTFVRIALVFSFTRKLTLIARGKI